MMLLLDLIIIFLHFTSPVSAHTHRRQYFGPTTAKAVASARSDCASVTYLKRLAPLTQCNRCSATRPPRAFPGIKAMSLLERTRLLPLQTGQAYDLRKADQLRTIDSIT